MVRIGATPVDAGSAMGKCIAKVAAAVGILLWMTLQSAVAQSPAVNPAESQQATQQQQRQVQQPLNNEPVWKEIRSGEPQFTSLPGRETNVLIQSGGQLWRAARNTLLELGQVVLVLAIGGLAIFYLIRGTMTYARVRGDRVIRRFEPIDRFAHWLLAICWVTLAITGLIMSIGKAALLPVVGYTIFSWLATISKYLHNFIGPVLIVAVPLMFVRFVRDNGVGMEDVRWFANIIGYFKGHEYPSGKYNAGEKLVFWVVLVALSTILIVSGLVLLFPNFDQTRATMQTANLLHVISAYVAIGLACVHIYLGTIGMTGAYRAMRYGYVDESWARHHHLRWYEAILAGKAREPFVDPAEVPVREDDVPVTPTRRPA
jgi:formate dehydrogenase subunit gamma